MFVTFHAVIFESQMLIVIEVQAENRL